MSLPNKSLPLTCIIVTYNRAEQLRDCLVYTLQQDVDHVIVIDNGSTDHTARLLEEFKRTDSRLVVERQRRGRGGSWGFARGMRLGDRLMRSKGWLLLYDDDAWPEPGCINTFRRRMRAYEDQGITAVGAAVFGRDGKAVESNRPVLNLFRRPLAVLKQTAPTARSLRDLYHVPHGVLDRSGNQVRVDSISFVGLFLNLRGLPQGHMRYPRGGLFLYSDDTTYSLGLVRCGRRLLLDTDLRFRHATKGGGAAARRLTPAWKHYYIVRNSFLMNYSLSKLWYVPLCLATLATHVGRGLLDGCQQGDWSQLKLVLLGAWDGMRNYYSRSHEALEAISAGKRGEESGTAA